MERTYVNNTDNFSICGWMINELKLSGNELLVYAIIYSYSRNSLNKFYGSLDYLANYTNATKMTIVRSLKSLLEKNYIVKLTNNKNYITNEYIANLELECIKKLNNNMNTFPIRKV